MNSRYKEKLHLIHKTKPLMYFLSIVAVLSTFSFSKQQRRARIKELNYQCQHCSQQFKQNLLTPHHRLPRQMGGNDTNENMYIVCPGCHKQVDKMAIRNGKLPDKTPITAIGNLCPKIIGDKRKYNKAKKRFL